MTPLRANLGKLGLGATFVAAILLFMFVSDLGVQEPTVMGAVVANIEQVAEMKSPENQIQVRLEDGVIVNAWVPANSGFPFEVGTPVRITPYRGRLLGKRTYWVRGSQ